QGDPDRAQAGRRAREGSGLARRARDRVLARRGCVVAAPTAALPHPFASDYGQPSNCITLKPLGTDDGLSGHSCAAAARGSSKPLVTKSTRSSISLLVSTIGLARIGSSRASTGSIGPSRARRSTSTPAVTAL